MAIKQCTKCKEWKEESKIYFKIRDQNKFRGECKLCINAIKRNSYKNNNADKQDKIKSQKEELKQQKTLLKLELREKSRATLVSRKVAARKKWAENNDMKSYLKKYYQDNIYHLKRKAKEYYLANYDKIKKSKNEYRKKRLAKDPAYRLRCAISKYINRSLAKVGVSKNNASYLKYVDWTPTELKIHLEAQFEPWMNWNNHGPAKTGEKRWHVDHIIPQSALLYNSMEHPNFKKCWALSNLRPLDSIENLNKANKIKIDI